MLVAPEWPDYGLLDSGDGAKLERFGPYVLARPERQAIWARLLPQRRWDEADAVFEPGDSGAWECRRALPERWLMRHGGLAFWARLSPFRHTGVFPEQSAHWLWLEDQIRPVVAAGRQVRVLDLFGYTGLATLSAARAGASVTYVDASRPAMTWARDNQVASGLEDRAVRWLLDDVPKFVRRERRRGGQYEGILLDPPVFGRGPKGEIWRFHEHFPELLDELAPLLSPEALFVLVNAYAVPDSSLMLLNTLAGLLPSGRVDAGELVIRESGSGRLLSTGIFGRWQAGQD